LTERRSRRIRAEALWHGGRAGDAGRRHDGLHISPCRRAAPAPEPQGRKLRISLCDPQLEHLVKLAKHIRRQRHLPHDPALSALESLNARNAALDVDRGGGERENFRVARQSGDLL